ncbi:MAG: hypothetical protein MUF21_11820 [Gemmatimonadaceae bacterium]|jgi:hypothetical protein|nr:hypothetical protein [Gemmatimonadaceae bacterium]MCU0627154.1 hypothetical protein [Gemmatimonadaceae bacterium]
MPDRHPVRLLAALVVAATVAAAPARVAAQQVPAPASELPVRNVVVQVNPFTLITPDFVAGEIEFGVGSNTSLGVNALHFWPRRNRNTDDDTWIPSPFDFDEFDRFTNVDVVLRWYPGGRRLKNLSIGPSVGYYRQVSAVPSGCQACVSRTEESPTIGFQFDQRWIIGSSQRFTIGLGVGAQRLLNQPENTDLPFARIFPRFSMGWAF